MTAPVFVDTNVLIYARDAGQPAKQPVALAWLDRLWRTGTGRTSVQVLSEYYVNVTRKLDPGLPPDEAWDDVKALMAWRPHPINTELLERTRELVRRNRLSWWDGLIVAAAQESGCGLLLSEDFHDGAVFGDVTVRSPFKLNVEEGAELYTMTRADRRAPRRGRPRRVRG